MAETEERPQRRSGGLGRFWRLMRARLSRRVALSALAAILLLETAILLPQIVTIERNLLDRQRHAAFAIVERLSFRIDEETTPRDIERIARREVIGLTVRGLTLYRDGDLFLTIGETPEAGWALAARPGNENGLRSRDRDRTDMAWQDLHINLPYDVVARLDTSWIDREVKAIILKVVLQQTGISLAVTLVVLLVVGLVAIGPLVELRNKLVQAARDPANPDRYTLDVTRRDELGEVVLALNKMLRQISRNYREEIERVVAMTDGNLDAIIAFSPQGKLRYCNAACLELCEFESRDKLASAGLPLVETEDEELPVSLVQYLERPGTCPGVARITLIVRGGRKLPCILTANRLTNSAGRTTLLFATLRDASRLGLAGGEDGGGRTT